jgi:hypothetical protein
MNVKRIEMTEIVGIVGLVGESGGGHKLAAEDFELRGGRQGQPSSGAHPN